MAQMYDYQCGNCGSINTEEEWNEETFKYTTAYDIGSSWREDEYFFPLAKAIEDRSGAWFHCPTCKEMGHGNNFNEISPVLREFKMNRDAKSLLSKEY
jgi:hypothetical protein